ncbi:PQQ-dependent sugar dehydrogenase [Candidatus Poribacteria bacterium]|nr:PQQ-dependent sugar dehydrogenase [Candidatus Poribacteria bacterium]
MSFCPFACFHLFHLLQVFIIIVATSVTIYARAEPEVPPGFTVTAIASSLDFPVTIAFPPDGRLFYTEKNTGRIRIIENDVLLPLPFVDVPVNTVSERGLLGIAFHPNFESNGYVYAYYTLSSTGSDTNVKANVVDNRVVRFTANGNVAQPGSETLIISLPVEPGPNHDGGNIRFGPDGKLYVTIGELAVSSNSLDRSVVPGEILRLNDDGSAPIDNPFANDGDENTRAEIYAYGLRNSFDFAFHPTTGTLFATENGPDNHDEINVIEAGKDYGWDKVQGIADMPAELDYANTHPDYRDPILDIMPTTTAPTGIDFWVDIDLFFGEFNTGKIRRMTLMGPNLDQVAKVEDFGTGFGNITDVQVAPEGTLYVATIDTIYRIQEMPVDQVEITRAIFLNASNLLLVTATSSAAPEAELRLTVEGCVTDAPMNFRNGQYLFLTRDCAGLGNRTAQVTSSFGGSDSTTIRGIGTGIVAGRASIPDETRLLQNRPNPFNPETWIPYVLSQDSDVRIRIYDLKGHLVRTLDLGYRRAGWYDSSETAAHWDGRNELGDMVSSGVYVYHLVTPTFQQMKRMVILK